MNTNLTDITVVLDRSGSMESIRQDTIGGINTFVLDQQQVSGQARLTLIQFDSLYEVNYVARDLREVQPLTLNDFVPRGSTALNDALGRAIDETGNRLRMTPESDRPGKVIFVIMTDGQENASHKFSAEQVKQKVTHQSQTYNWQFVYLGANQDAFVVGDALGIAAGSTINYTASGIGTKNVFKSVSNNMTAYRSGGDAYSFTVDDVKMQDEALKHGTTTGGTQ